MKFKFVFLIVFLTFFLPLSDACACTSFAAYSNQVYYGMNFDFANLPMKFLIFANGDIRTFHLAFERTMGEMKFFVNTAGMNNKGLFSSCQELHPISEYHNERNEKNMFVFELYDAIAGYKSAGEIEGLARTLSLIDMPGVSVHNFFADTTGKAFVTEAGALETAIIEKENNFMVMTNFPNRSMIGKNYKEAQGKGDERYIICHEYLQKHASDFNIEKGFQLLEMCTNKDPLYPTGCSMVFDPQKQEVFIVLERNFSKVLKLSIAKGTIETFKGYEKKFSSPIPIGVEGLLIKDLYEKLK